MADPFPGGFDPRMFEQVPLFRELKRIMEWRGGPVNWDFARQTAGALATAGGDPGRGDRDSDELASAVAAAELWLDEVTALPAVDGPVRALSRGEWTQLAATSEGLGVYIEPIAEGMAAALSSQLPAELAGLMGGAGGPNPLTAVGAMMYGLQSGMIAGNLAGQLLSTYDLGVPTVEPSLIGTVGDAAERFADDYAIDRTELRYWLALREAAHRRQYAGVPWLRGHLADLVRRFAAEADLDAGQLFEQLGGLGLDPSDPEALQQALQSPDAFSLEPTTAQQAVLTELQTLVSFLLAWADTVVDAAAGDKLTALPRIVEALRRRRAEQGPGERFLTQLVGLDLSPADIRQAQSFCDAVVAARGHEGLDRVWQQAGYLPSADELVDPSRWLVRMAAAELAAGDDSDD